MRLLHTFEKEAHARTFADALYAAGLQSTVREGGSGWLLMLHDETAMEQAKGLLAEYEADPGAPKFASLKKRAKAVRKDEKQREKSSRHAEKRARETLLEDATQTGPLTMFLIGASVIVAFHTSLGEELSAVGTLSFSYFRVEGSSILMATGFRSILVDHEIWRAITPIFVHFGPFHIVFNLLWTYRFGGAIEKHSGFLVLLGIVLVAGISGNVTQYLWSGHPRFGGLSGVVYAFFGYLWIRGRLDPSYPVRIPSSTVWILLGWFALCFTGFMPIANGAHTAGLVVGVLWGFLASGYLRRKLGR